MNCEKLKAMVNSGAHVIDVRTPNEHTASRITGSVNIPLAALPNQLLTLKKDSKLLLYCRSGARSGAAASYLSERGYDAINIGGISPFIGCLEY